MLSVEIRTKGLIAEQWSPWFEGLEIDHTPEGETVLRGAVADQAALYGLVSRLRDLGMPLVSVHSVEIGDPHASGAQDASGS